MGRVSDSGVMSSSSSCIHNISAGRFGTALFNGKMGGPETGFVVDEFIEFSPYLIIELQEPEKSINGGNGFSKLERSKPVSLALFFCFFRGTSLWQDLRKNDPWRHQRGHTFFQFLRLFQYTQAG